MSKEQRRLAAIMYTDMVGYTALGQRNESLSLALVDKQRKLVRPVLIRHNGREVKTMGDAFLVEFPSALDAVRCAYEIQRATREFNIPLPEERRVRLRVGIHLGDVVESHGDISGDAVNVASRIESLADEGGVCLTRQVFDHVQNKFDLQFTSLGTQVLKNVSVPLEVYKLKMPWEEMKPASMLGFQKTRIAVLPFVNMSPDPGDEYFADGTTEEMISTLSNISNLTTISRTSVMQYKGVRKSLSDIGRELRVGSILEGSVRKSGNRVRITVQLIDAIEDKHLWSQSYDREIQDVFAVQSDVAKSVAEALRVKLLASEASQIQKKPTENMEAYLAYLNGRQHLNKRSEESIRKAIEYFKQAIDHDSNFALAYAALSDCYLALTNIGVMIRAEAGEKQRAAALKALQLDDKLPEAHTAYGSLLAVHDMNIPGAEPEIRKALELNANNASSHIYYSFLLRDKGRFEESLAEAKKALELDPITPLMIVRVGSALYALERYDDAIAYASRALAIEPNYHAAMELVTDAYAMKKDFDQATAWWEKSARIAPSNARTIIKLAIIQAKAGKSDEALKTLDSALKLEDSGKIHPMQLATLYALLHDEDKAFRVLEKALDDHVQVASIRAEPMFQEFRTNPRFVRILNKLGLDK